MSKEIIRAITMGDIIDTLALVATLISTATVIWLAAKRLVSRLIKPLRLDIKRVELLQLINDQPQKVDVIIKAYEDYKRLGGNSYMDGLYAEWYDEFALPVIRDRLPLTNKEDNNGRHD